MPRGLTLLISLLSLASLSATAGGDFRVTTASGREKVTIKWIATDETGVSAYEILRRDWGQAPDAALTLTSIAVTPGVEYSFEDKTLFRTLGKAFVYTIRPVGAGRDKDQDVSIIFESVSGVRKTWGSIKAMFR